MQILYTAGPETEVDAPGESEIGAALRQLDESIDSGGRPVVHLAKACAAALHALDEMIGEGGESAAHFAQAMHVDEQVQACYERIGRWLLSPTSPEAALPAELMRSSAQLFRGLSAVYSNEDIKLGVSALGGQDPVLPLLRALWCLGMHAKWTYFMHHEADGSLWRTYHGLYERTESIGAARRAIAPYRDPDAGKLSCADVYVQSLLLGMLNGGNLSPQQLELAHRWVVAFVRDAGITANDNGTPNVLHVCLDSDRGLQSGAPTADEVSAVRFVDIQPICLKLLDSRENLRRGKIDLSDAGLQVAVLDYGAFLDLAERFWSPNDNQVQERAPRIGMAEQPVEAVMGFDRVFQSAGGTLAKTGPEHPGETAEGGSNITFLYADAEQVTPPFTCTLKDRSASGVGLLVAGASGMPAPGALVGFRMSRDHAWEAGVLVRRLALPGNQQTLLGIKTIASRPIAVTLRHANTVTAAQADKPVEFPAIFAPTDAERSRPDSLIVREAAFSRNADFVLTTSRAKFLVRLSRVLHRGAGWVRAGFRVLSKI